MKSKFCWLDKLNCNFIIYSYKRNVSRLFQHNNDLVLLVPSTIVCIGKTIKYTIYFIEPINIKIIIFNWSAWHLHLHERLDRTIRHAWLLRQPFTRKSHLEEWQHLRFLLGALRLLGKIGKSHLWNIYIWTLII